MSTLKNEVLNNPHVKQIARIDAGLANEIADQGGFLSTIQIEKIAKIARLMPLMVRCGACRFTAPAQDVIHLTKIITEHAADYVRDVSIPC